MAKVLTKNDITNCRTYAKNFSQGIESFKRDVDIVLKAFDNKEIFQKFFLVGKFGEKQKQELEKLKNGVNKFYQLLSKDGGLVAEHKPFIDKAETLNKTGNN